MLFRSLRGSRCPHILPCRPHHLPFSPSTPPSRSFKFTISRSPFSFLLLFPLSEAQEARTITIITTTNKLLLLLLLLHLVIGFVTFISLSSSRLHTPTPLHNSQTHSPPQDSHAHAHTQTLSYLPFRLCWPVLAAESNWTDRIY